MCWTNVNRQYRIDLDKQSLVFFILTVIFRYTLKYSSELSLLGSQASKKRGMTGSSVATGGGGARGCNAPSVNGFAPLVNVSFSVKNYVLLPL